MEKKEEEEDSYEEDEERNNNNNIGEQIKEESTEGAVAGAS